MKEAFLFGVIVLCIVAAGCSNDRNTNNILIEDNSTAAPENSSVNINNASLNGTVNLSSLPNVSIEITSPSDNITTVLGQETGCAVEKYTIINNLTESPTGYGAIKISKNNIIYIFSYSNTGVFNVDALIGRNDPPLARLYIPTGVYTPEKAVRIDQHYAIKILNRSYARIDKKNYNETIIFELYNISDGCIAPEFDTSPLVTVSCGGISSSADCIGSRHDEFWIYVGARNQDNHTRFVLSLSIDGGENLLPFSLIKPFFLNTQSHYRIPAYTLEPGTHILTVEIETEEGVLFKENYKMMVLSDDKIAVRKYMSANFCDSNKSDDFIRYYDDGKEGMFLKHNYYIDGNFTLAVGGCADIPTGLRICDEGEKYVGTYDYRILALKNAESACPLTKTAREECKTRKTIEIGDDYKTREGVEYELVKIYTLPKLVAFKNTDKKWIVYFPYDNNPPFLETVSVESVNGKSVTMVDLDTSCYWNS